jgi:hypothetical protein
MSELYNKTFINAAEAYYYHNQTGCKKSTTFLMKDIAENLAVPSAYLQKTFTNHVSRMFHPQPIEYKERIQAVLNDLPNQQ